MITALISRLVILVFGTLYPAYASYKAVRTKDVKEYVKWMMYWIVFALFTCIETFTDVLFSFWFPFYYELKIGIVFWLLSPATKGSSFLYRSFVHPAFLKREAEIDDYLMSAKEKGYSTVMKIGSKGMSYATNAIVQTAIKGGGGIFEQLRKSYSLSDLSQASPSHQISKQTSDHPDTTDHHLAPEPRAVPRSRRGISGNQVGVEMYFSEVDVNVRQFHANDQLGEIRSTEDISSGYCSTDQLFTSTTMEGSTGLHRASSVMAPSNKTRVTRGAAARSSAAAQQLRKSALIEESLEGGDELISEDTSPYSSLPPSPDPPDSPDFETIRKKFELQSAPHRSTESPHKEHPSPSSSTPPPPLQLEEVTKEEDTPVLQEIAKKEGTSTFQEVTKEELVTAENAVTYEQPQANEKGDSILVQSPVKDTPVEEITKTDGPTCHQNKNIQQMLDQIVEVESKVLMHPSGGDPFVKTDKNITEGNRQVEDKFEILELSEPMFVRRPRSHRGSFCEEDQCSLLTEDGDHKSESDSERKGKYKKLPAPAPPPPPPETLLVVSSGKDVYQGAEQECPIEQESPKINISRNSNKATSSLSSLSSFMSHSRNSLL